MPYHLKSSESVPEGLKRIVGEQIESVLDQLNRKNRTNRDEAIHEARKRIKKIRGVLRLMEPELGETYPEENNYFRDVSHKLSEFRDAEAMIEVFDRLKERYKDELRTGPLISIRRALVMRKKQGEQQGQIDQVLDQMAVNLQAAGKRVKSWPIQMDGFAAIAPGLEKTYRRSQNAMDRLQRHASAEDYHQWRRRSKYHRYHIQLLEDLWVGVMQAYAQSLKDLDTWLGDDHNLVVLREKIVAEREFYGKDEEIRRLLSLIKNYQKELRESALSLGERIYYGKPGQFTARMEHLWSAWKSQPKSLKKYIKEMNDRHSGIHDQRAA